MSSSISSTHLFLGLPQGITTTLRNIQEERRSQFLLVSYIRRIDKHSLSSPVGRQFYSQDLSLGDKARLPCRYSRPPHQSAYHHITYKTRSILFLICITVYGWLRRKSYENQVGNLKFL